MAFILDGTTGIATVDGSVSAPSQRGQDTNSGISYAADTIKFSTGGVERMAITNSGVTGISQGKVVANAFASVTTNEQNTNGSNTSTLVGPQITHTAASTSNKLVFLHTHHLLVEDMTWGMILYRDGTSGTNLYQMESYTQDAQWIPTVGITNCTVSVPDTSSHTYQFAIYRLTGSDAKIRYSPDTDSSGSQIMMLEVEP